MQHQMSQRMLGNLYDFQIICHSDDAFIHDFPCTLIQFAVQISFSKALK